jgi:hypothetical protein
MSRSPRATRAAKRKKVFDIIAQQDDLKAHRCTFVLAPKLWATYRNKTVKTWSFSRLRQANRVGIPASSGIYTLLIQPNLARHTECSYLMYIGQAVSLKRRFGEYLNAERLETGRPKIFRLLNIYDRHIWFGFTNVQKGQLDKVEDDLIKAHLPPCNDKLPTKIAKAAKAF